MDLNASVRMSLARRLLASLQQAVPGSTAELRGSLAEGRADPYSDIDLLWEIPDDAFQPTLDRLSGTLSQVHPLESLRIAPDFQNSDRRRLVFVQFVDVPLFWRVDLDILAQSLHGDDQYDLDNEAARGDDWSRTHSALMNAVAAIKALLRNREEEAEQLLVRGFHRVGLQVPEASCQQLILELAENVAGIDATKAALARRVEELYHQAFSSEEGSANSVGSKRPACDVAGGPENRS